MISSIKDSVHEIDITHNLPLYTITEGTFRQMSRALNQLNNAIAIDEIIMIKTSLDAYSLVITGKDTRTWNQQINTSDEQNTYSTLQTDSWSDRERDSKLAFRQELMRLTARIDIESITIQYF